MVFVWFHTEHAPPSFAVPDLEAVFGPLDRARYFRLEVDSTVQDMNENGLDLGHFSVTHGVRYGVGFAGPARLENLAFEGAELGFEVHSQAAVLGHKVDALVEMRFFGPAIFIARNVRPLPFDVIALHQPVSEERTVAHVLAMPRLPVRLANRLVRRPLARRVRSEIAQDVLIWNRQRHNPAPVLSSADGPIHRYRKWIKRFYAA